MGEDESLRAMEQELDDDLCVLNIHHLVLVGRIARQLVRPTIGLHAHNKLVPSINVYCNQGLVQGHGPKPKLLQLISNFSVWGPSTANDMPSWLWPAKY